MIQRDLLQTIRELCESAVYLYSLDKIGRAHQLLAQCEEILLQNGLGENALRGDPFIESRFLAEGDGLLN